MSRKKHDPFDNPEIAFIEPTISEEETIPEQREHFQLPTRFGAVPVDEAPLGWEVETRRRETKVTKFQHVYPTIRLPFQEVQRAEFGHNGKYLEQNAGDRKLAELFPTGANRLFFGDNLHVMRQLPSASIDLIYIDPPFFSGRNYNVIFGDRNEVRSFSDIWEGGMPGYLVWLNARLWEMKRLLRPSGAICVHLDWHASHYVKVELDKIFGYDRFINEIIWQYKTGGMSKKWLGRKHDTILVYSRSEKYKFFPQKEKSYLTHKYGFSNIEILQDKGGYYTLVGMRDVWDIPALRGNQPETIGYPTQKPEQIVERLASLFTETGDVVADFFGGGGTTPAVAQRLNRRWIACDQSRIAVAITADRVSKVISEQIGNLFPAPDFSIEHWGIYEAPKLEQYDEDKFQEFVVRAFGGRPEQVNPSIHGVRQGIPLFVGEPSRSSRITRDDVARFAKAVYEGRRTNFGVMLGWNFAPDARKAAEILAARENKRIDFVRLTLVRFEDDDFREHVVKKSAEYGPLLSFIQPPEVRVVHHRLKALTYEFDVSESVSLNREGSIANVQWDFDHKPGYFVSSQGYTFLRDKKTRRPVLVVTYKFPKAGTYTIACSVQDDQGGERTAVLELEVK